MTTATVTEKNKGAKYNDGNEIYNTYELICACSI